MNFNNIQQSGQQSLPQTHQITSQLLNHVRDIVIDGMKSFWNIPNPTQVQIDVTSKLLLMNLQYVPPNPILMVQPTGSGKTLVPLTYGTIVKSVIIIIENTLSLSSDQCNRVKDVKQIQGHPVSSIHLNNIRTTSQKKAVSNYLSNIESSTNTTIFLYSSPDLLSHEDWKPTIISMLSNKSIRLICIDEIHQFVQFASSFRPSFSTLYDSLISKICNNIQSSSDSSNPISNNLCATFNKRFDIPILCMTATFTPIYQHTLSRILRISFQPENIFWCNNIECQRCNITIEACCTNLYKKKTSDTITHLLSSNDEDKAIVFTNTAKQAETMKKVMDDAMDYQSLKFDSVMIHGSTFADIKNAAVIAFTSNTNSTNTQHNTSQNTSSESTTTTTNSLPADTDIQLIKSTISARVLIATAGSIGTGLDSVNTTTVMRIGLPTSILDFIQEMG